MTEFETDLNSKYDSIDVENILSKIERRSLVFARKKCIFQSPEFVQRLPPEQTVEEGTTVTFGCKVVGFPKPSITWFKDEDLIGSHSRAIINSDETGFHFLNLQEVSKCDAGKYKVRASNAEGSSASMLYLSVKDKSKSRNRKKKKTRAVACAPLFPVIVEHEAEESRETQEVELQAESPLTPIYATNSRRSPVVWPPFLGDWAYSADDVIHKDEDLDVGCEDVFDDDEDDDVKSCTNGDSSHVSPGDLNDTNNIDGPFTSSDVTECINLYNTSKYSAETHCKKVVDDDNSNHGIKKGDNSFILEQTNLKSTNGDSVIDNCEKKVGLINVNDGVTKLTSWKSGILINNNMNAEVAEVKNDESVQQINKITSHTCHKVESNTPRHFVVPSKELSSEEKTIYMDTSTMQISVNRSYAKGDKTFSVATRRSPSPYANGQNPRCFSTEQTGGNSPQKNDTSILQNLNNERILSRMRQMQYTNSWWWKFITSRGYKSIDDHLLEVILLICGCTFLALYFEVPPATFVADIFIALVIKAALVCMFSEL